MRLTDVVFRTTALNKLHIRNHRDIGYKHKVIRVPALKDQIQGKNVRESSAQCVNEMTVMMDCWKARDFNQSLCAKEMQSFHNCMAAAELAAKDRKERTSQGLPVKGSRLRPSQQVNEMLARYPQPPATHFK